MRNIIKTSQFISVTLDDGTVLVTTDTSNEMFVSIREAESDEAIIMLIDSSYTKEKPVASNILKEVYSGEKESRYIVFKGSHAYIPSISELTVPQDFVEEILAAEENDDQSLLEAYLNFWTLVSMNPDSRVRDNIFWFIRKWDIKISKSGFLIAYRNADFKQNSSLYSKDFIDKVTNDYIKIKAQKKSPNNYTYKADKLCKLENDERDRYTSLAEWYIKVTDKEDTIVFTDHHSHTFKIKIGVPVSMPREACCSDHNVSCSTGLHAGSAGWLEENYFGDTGLMVLINPADVTSIPIVDDYGKLRCCRYLPVGIVHFDESGHVEDMGIDHAYEDGYLLDYSQEINNEDANNYIIEAFKTYGIDREVIRKRVMEMAEKFHNES